MKINWTVWLFAIAALTACAADSGQNKGHDAQQAAKPAAQAGLDKIQNIVVIYAENRSFDHLYGSFPGADGIAQATAEQKAQLDFDGKPLPRLPAVYTGGKPDPRFQ